MIGAILIESLACRQEKSHTAIEPLILHSLHLKVSSPMDKKYLLLRNTKKKEREWRDDRDDIYRRRKQKNLRREELHKYGVNGPLSENT